MLGGNWSERGGGMDTFVFVMGRFLKLLRVVKTLVLDATRIGIGEFFFEVGFGWEVGTRIVERMRGKFSFVLFGKFV